MRVDSLIKLLETWQSKHGPAAQIAVPSDVKGDGDDFSQNCREEVYVQSGPISTVLTSRGDIVEF